VRKLGQRPWNRLTASPEYFQQLAKRQSPERHDHSGTDQDIKLLLEEGAALFSFGRRRTILRRSTTNSRRDVRPLEAQAVISPAALGLARKTGSV
jgi:hypothetical protein